MATNDPGLKPIEDELGRIEESAKYSAESQFVQAKIWRLVNLVLGIPAATLAAVAGATGLASTAGRTPAAIMALVAAGLGAVMTTLNAGRRAEQAHVSANAYRMLQNDARVAKNIDLHGSSVDQARSGLSELMGRQADISKAAEIPFRIAYWLGKRNIRRGGTEYQVGG